MGGPDLLEVSRGWSAQGSGNERGRHWSAGPGLLPGEPFPPPPWPGVLVAAVVYFRASSPAAPLLVAAPVYYSGVERVLFSGRRLCVEPGVSCQG